MNPQSLIRESLRLWLHKIFYGMHRAWSPLDTGVLTTDRDKVVRPPPFRGGLTTQNLEDTLEGNFTMVAA